MSFDSSRFPFSPWNDFNGVVMQQGRVQLDSDWNEWLAELGRRIRAGTLDTVGRAVYPVALPNSFLITPVSGSITIGVGRMYVDGLLVENHGLTAPATQGWVPGSASSPSGSGATWDDSLDELYINVPVDYDKQPYYPNAPAFPTSPGPFLIYLDVWQREVTFLEDPDLIEKAVGVDTTGRLQVVWQVKLLDLTNVTVPGGVVCTTQDSDIGPWATLIQPSAGRLTTGVVQSSSSGPCCLAPNTGYTGMENQLYRVEIHQGGSASSGPTATFKWSRDNASVATAVTGIGQAGLVLTVQSTGKDSVLRFSPNDWVEITDDYLEVNGQHGELHQVSLVSDTANTITLSSAVSATSFPANTTTGLTDPSRHTRVVRWDQGGKVFESDGATVWVDLGAAGSTGDIPVPPPGTSLILENGVTVSFDLSPSTGSFQIGDYWAFAARATDGTVESLVEAPPLGIHHHYARLALVTPPDTPSDCRIPWPPSFDEGCDCTVCVTAASHKAGGTGTIQAAINKVLTLTPPGGKICLGPGTYNIAQTVTVSGASNIQITGHGLPILMATNLPGNDPIMLITSESVDITIEDLGFSTAAQPGGAGQSSLRGLIVQDSSFVRVNRCLFAPSPNGSQLSPAIALGGTVSDSSIRGNSFNNVQLGIGLMDEIKTHFLSYISIEYNQMTCTSAGVALAPDDPSSGALALRFANNSIQSAAGFEMLSFNAVDLVVEENTFMIGGSPNGGDGIVCSGDGTSFVNAVISDNLISRAGEISGVCNGIVLGSLMDGCQVTGNVIGRLTGTGILIQGAAGETRLLETIIAQNQLASLGMGGIVMQDGSSATDLNITGNYLDTIALTNDGTDSSQPYMVGISLATAISANVSDNVIQNLGIPSELGTTRVGIFAIGVSGLRVAGNRIVNFAPQTAVATSGGIFAEALGSVEVVDNEVRRALNPANNGDQSTCLALFVGSSGRGEGVTPSVSVLGNTLESFGGNALTVGVGAREVSCIFSNNQCFLDNTQAGPGVVAEILANSIIASGNLALGPLVQTNEVVSPAMILEASSDPNKGVLCTVIGNITSTGISVNGGTMPAAMVPLNVTTLI